MRLGYDIYTLLSQGWNAFQHIDYAQRTDLQVVHFSDLTPFASLDDSYLVQVKTHADRSGIDLEVGMLSICPTSSIFSGDRGTATEQLSEMLHIARLLGSPIVRCVLGANADRTGPLPLESHVQATVQTCRAVRQLAVHLQVKIAIENHAGDLQGRELRELIERAGPEYVGACIDTGNPLWVAESPFVTLSHLAPYVLTSHVRDSAVWAHPQGAAVQWVAMGEGSIGIDRWARRFKEACPDSAFSLEIITGGLPRVLNYLDAGFWTAYPNTPGAEFAQFVRLVRQGRPFTGARLTVDRSGPIPDAYQAALSEQERVDLERSVHYCKTVLGIGTTR